ncbi:hypothetical protein [Bradyrhizobium sp. 30]|uniref:hypothetical protein n=1 Tax=Bradyrhizobium sp. 30 TaxID=2782669 RepID=UPI001FFB23D8|nr:hypothetical protein [Bradyrhizobium sp. 30]MCK1291284.1 hypothetical protein [Bradyrhizobium sp. 30]
MTILAAAARIFRDWLGVPVAAITLVTAFFYPAAGTILGWFGRDRASISAQLFNVDHVNVGLDDQPASSRVDKVAEHEGLLRGQLVNDGFSVASIVSNFSCTGADQPDGRIVYTFSFYDPQKGTKLFPEIPARSTLSFFGRLIDANIYTEATRPVPGPKKCTFSYFDKYGFVQPTIFEINDRQAAMLGMLVVQEESVEWRNKYCEGMITRLPLSGKDVADCVDETHVFAIEPSYRWTAAIGRSLSYAKSFAELARSSQNTKTPGLILVCDPDNTDCNAERRAATGGLDQLKLSARLWLCSAKDSALKDCEQIDFPRRAKSEHQ